MPPPISNEAPSERINKGSERSRLGEFFRVWFMAWAGTVFAGAVFGMIAGSGLGLFFGPLFAGFFGAPVIVTFATITWAFWLTRFTVLIAAIAGGCTGLLSTALTWGVVFHTNFPMSLLHASLIGALGGGAAAGWYWTTCPRVYADNVADDTWHYSLRDLFIRFTIVAVLVACWTFTLGRVLDVHNAARIRMVNNWNEFD